MKQIFLKILLNNKNGSNEFKRELQISEYIVLPLTATLAKPKVRSYTIHLRHAIFYDFSSPIFQHFTELC